MQKNLPVEYSVYILKSLIWLISGLAAGLLSIIVYIIKRFKKSQDLLWSKYHIMSDQLNKLQGEHEAICRRKNDR